MGRQLAPVRRAQELLLADRDDEERHRRAPGLLRRELDRRDRRDRGRPLAEPRSPPTAADLGAVTTSRDPRRGPRGRSAPAELLPVVGPAAATRSRARHADRERTHERRRARAFAPGGSARARAPEIRERERGRLRTWPSTCSGHRREPDDEARLVRERRASASCWCSTARDAGDQHRDRRRGHAPGPAGAGRWAAVPSRRSRLDRCSSGRTGSRCSRSSTATNGISSTPTKTWAEIRLSTRRIVTPSTKSSTRSTPPNVPVRRALPATDGFGICAWCSARRSRCRVATEIFTKA